jgi:Raf kinase inhibitor-like YbhB/YbcL family protein
MLVRSAFLPWRLGFVLLLLTALCSCQAGEKKAAGTKTPDPQPTASPQGEKSMKITVTSSAFKEGSPIPKKHTGEGDDVSPPLEWSGVPEGTRQLALICDDPDAPRKDPWVHWVICNIPADAKGLPEGVEAVAKPKQPAGSVQGKNSWPDGENMGYRGPMPPPGKPHRYFFKLYALDQAVDAKPGLTKEELLSKISGHVLAEGQLMGTYQRK